MKISLRKSRKVCYNVNAFDKVDNSKVKAFLEYVKTHVAKDDFTHKLESIIERTKESDTFRRDYMMRNIFIDDWYDRGIAQGEHKKAIETARALLALGVVTVEQIAQVTDLPLEEVQRLQIVVNVDL